MPGNTDLSTLNNPASGGREQITGHQKLEENGESGCNRNTVYEDEHTPGVSEGRACSTVRIYSSHCPLEDLQNGPTFGREMCHFVEAIPRYTL